MNQTIKRADIPDLGPKIKATTTSIVIRLTNAELVELIWPSALINANHDAWEVKSADLTEYVHKYDAKTTKAIHITLANTEADAEMADELISEMIVG